MILYCSRSLAERLPDVADPPLEELSPLGSWHGHLFRFGRRQCVLLCHNASRYLLFLPGVRKEQLLALRHWHRMLYLAVLEADGTDLARLRRVELALGAMRCVRGTDRSVMATIRVAQQDLKDVLEQSLDSLALDPVAVSLWLNQRPVTVHGERFFPQLRMAECIEAL